MPIRRARKATRKPRRRMPMRRRKAVGRASVKRTSDYAKLVETYESKLYAISDGAGNSTGEAISFCLQDYQRAQEVAHAYKYYRASKVELLFIPYFNIAQTGGGGATQLPQLYMSVDRLSNRFNQPDEKEMLERGITPRLFNKKQLLMFKPNLLQGISLETRQPADGQGTALGVDLVGYQNSIPIFNKWLPTQQSAGYNVLPPNNQVNQVLAPLGVNPYALNYHGAIWCAAIEGQGAGTVTVGDVQVKVTWEFKGPRALKANPPNNEDNQYVITSSQGNPGNIPNTQSTEYP